MKHGVIVERGPAQEIFYRPAQPYTIQLLDSVPHLGSVVAREGVVTAANLAEGLQTQRNATAAPAGETTDGATQAAADGPSVFAGPAPLSTFEPIATKGIGTADLSKRTADTTNGSAGTTPTAAPDITKRSGLLPGVEAVVDLRAIAVEYPRRGSTPAFRAVDNFNLEIGRGEVVGLVGESGSGKTTIGRALVGLLPFVSGEAHVVGTDMVTAKGKDLRTVRTAVSFVFQDPGSSLNPRLPIGESIGEPLYLHKVSTGKKDLSNRIEGLLDQVQLSRSLRNRYPHELSGGQRQRVGIARALALSPHLLIADEPTSALDVSVQAKVLELFQELQRDQGFACLFISHDLAVVEILARRIVVMHHGKLVEMGTKEQILSDPKDPYTQRLLAAVPVPNPEEQQIRRKQRDALLAAGIGVEPDEYAVFPEHSDEIIPREQRGQMMGRILAREYDDSEIPPERD